MPARKPKPGFQTATLIAGVVMLLIIFVSAGYILTLPASDPTDNRDPRLVEIEQQRSLWRQRQPEAYEYVVDRDCDCTADYAEPYRVTVSADGKTFRFDAGYGEPGVRDRPAEPADIEVLFDLVEAALVAGHTVQVFYDTDYGFPAIARINQGGRRSDEEYAFDVRNFRILR